MKEVVRVDGNQDVDGRRRSPFTFIIWISDRNKFVIILIKDLIGVS